MAEYIAVSRGIADGIVAEEYRRMLRQRGVDAEHGVKWRVSGADEVFADAADALCYRDWLELIGQGGSLYAEACGRVYTF